MARLNDARVWGLWSNVCGAVVFCDPSQSKVRNALKMFAPEFRRGMEIVRFDLSPIYKQTKEDR